jgi:hypothetical protein
VDGIVSGDLSVMDMTPDAYVISKSGQTFKSTESKGERRVRAACEPKADISYFINN